MADINEILNARKEALEKLMAQIEKELSGMPEGRLRINHRRAGPGSTQYYQCIPGGSRNGIYISKSEERLAYKLARKSYLQLLKEQIRLQLSYLSNDVPDLSNKPLLDVFNNMTADRQKLVIPLLEDDKAFTERWLSVEYDHLLFEPETPVHMTDRGERVRSKSEKILADRFNALGIPYLYEKPIKTGRNKRRIPDFTLLNIRKREVYYWEHFGMMDDKDYVNANIDKINEYARVGIIPGKNLIMTFETKDNVLDTTAVNNIIKAYLL